MVYPAFEPTVQKQGEGLQFYTIFALNTTPEKL